MPSNQKVQNKRLDSYTLYCRARPFIIIVYAFHSLRLLLLFALIIFSFQNEYREYGATFSIMYEWNGRAEIIAGNKNRNFSQYGNCINVKSWRCDKKFLRKMQLRRASWIQLCLYWFLCNPNIYAHKTKIINMFGTVYTEHL